MQQLTADDFYRLAADLADEHGSEAMDFARRAVAAFEAEGAVERARFWFMMCIFLDDLAENRGDPERPVTIH